jgi:hypothetical protein
VDVFVSVMLHAGAVHASHTTAVNMEALTIEIVHH